MTIPRCTGAFVSLMTFILNQCIETHEYIMKKEREKERERERERERGRELLYTLVMFRLVSITLYLMNFFH